MPKYIIFCVALLGTALLLSACEDDAKPTTTPQAARFEEAPCVAALPDGQPSDTVRCGFVAVPEDRSASDPKLIRLAVMVLEAEGPSRVSDPIVYLSGGPGISALQNDLSFFGEWLDIPLQAKRDIVLFDQRGTGFSEPSLVCEGDQDAARARLDKDLSVDQEIAEAEDVARACRERLLENGVKLTAFNSLASVEDTRDIMTALGYTTWNIYAFSYGTRIAMAAMNADPQHVRAVVLDSTKPPWPKQVDRAASLQRTITRLLDECIRDAACALAFPEVHAELDGVLNRLSQNPVRIEAGGVDVLMTPARFVDALFRRLSAPNLAAIPADIHALSLGDNTRFQPYAEALVAGWIGIAGGALISASCAEDILPEEATMTNGDPPAREEFVDGVRLFGGLWPLSDTFCEEWGVPAITVPTGSTASNVRALILSGSFDAGEPSSSGEAVAALLQGSYFFEVPNAGHAVGFTFPLCVGAIAAAFLDAPDAEPDASCLEQIPPVTWAIR